MVDSNARPYIGRKNFGGSRFYMCERKKAFADESTAVSRAQSIRDKGGPEMNAYKCRYCQGYHLARKKQ